MKRTIKLLSTALVTITLLSCGNDDDTMLQTTISGVGFTTTVDENKLNGHLLGNVTGASNTGAVNYTLTSQSIANAMNIDYNTGNVTINNEIAFDFETNPTITALATIASGAITKDVNITINLNDIDDLASILSTSLTHYNNAAVGNWVEITETEYTDLGNNLNQVTTAGLKDIVFEQDLATLQSGASNFTITAKNDTDTELKIDNNEYVFAFKYINKASATVRSTDRVKISSSTDILTGYTDLGNTLPNHSGNGVKYFILKGNTIKNTAEGYLNFYSSANMGQKAISGYQNYYQSGNNNTFSGSTESIIYRYQALTTTQKQW